jgi:hypothetical protein
LTLLFLKHSKLQDLKRKKKGSNQDTMESWKPTQMCKHKLL